MLYINFSIYYFHIWIYKPSLDENKVPRTLFEARKVAGSAKYKQVKQYEAVLSFKFTLCIQIKSCLDMVHL